MERYKIIKKLGQGGFGEAFLAQDKRNSRKCVLKFNTLKNASKKGTYEEVKLLASLDHPNIVSYRGAFQTESSNLVIAMDYCEGGDLHYKIQQQKPRHFEESQIANWFIQICRALEYLHAKNILHRDLKPPNIFLTKNNVIKIGDFGIAKVLDSDSALATTCIGTQTYMGPEVHHRQPYNHKSDVWSLGCCIYEIVALEPAFKSLPEMFASKYLSIPGQYSSALIELIFLMLEGNPEKRISVAGILKCSYIKRNMAVSSGELGQRSSSPPLQLQRYYPNESSSSDEETVVPQITSSPFEITSSDDSSSQVFYIPGGTRVQYAERPAARQISIQIRESQMGASRQAFSLSRGRVQIREGNSYVPNRPALYSSSSMENLQQCFPALSLSSTSSSSSSDLTSASSGNFMSVQGHSSYQYSSFSFQYASFSRGSSSSVYYS